MDPSRSRKYRRIRGEVQRTVAEDEEFQMRQATQFQGGLLEAMPDMGAALARRAKRGRVDAIKLALEVTGVHNPKVKHEHSGEVNINLSMPRPDKIPNPADGPQRTELDDPGIVDADVVEE